MNAAQKQQAEEQEIRQVLDGIQMPESIAGVDFRLDTDWMGEPAVKISIVIKDGAWNDQWPRNFSRKVRESIREAFYDAGIERWPYISFYTEENMRELQRMRK